MKRTLISLAALLLLTGAVHGQKLTSVCWDKLNASPAPLKQIGKVEVVRHNGEGNSLWSVGCETVDRDFTVFSEYKDWIGGTGAGYARMQSGWAKTEKVRGVYDFAWIDEMVDGVLAQGVCPWISLGYANPIYANGEVDLNAAIFDDEDTMQGWLNYVREVVTRYKGKVTMYEIWNEPNGGKDPEKARKYANLFIRTAELIRKHDPQVGIAGLALAGTHTNFTRNVLEDIKAAGKLHLMDYATFHPYEKDPDVTVDSIKVLTGLIHSYSKDIKMLQGENGCPACLQYAFALSKYEWTEYSQAKWYLRRMATDFSLGIPSNIFTMVDVKYRHTVNYKGLLHTNLNGEVVWARPAYYAVSHMASLLTPHMKADGELAYKTPSKKSLSVLAVSKDGRRVGVLVWQKGEIPSDSISQEKLDLTVSGLALKDPVWVEPVTGRICELEKWSVKGGSMNFKGLPVWDSPVFIMERAEVPSVSGESGNQ